MGLFFFVVSTVNSYLRCEPHTNPSIVFFSRGFRHGGTNIRAKLGTKRLAWESWPFPQDALDGPLLQGPPQHPRQHLGLVRTPGLTSVLCFPKQEFWDPRSVSVRENKQKKIIMIKRKKKNQYYHCRSSSRPLVSDLLQHKVFISISRLRFNRHS